MLLNHDELVTALRDVLVAAGDDSRCVTSVPHGVGAEQRGQKTADSEMSVEQVGQAGIGYTGRARSRGGLAAA